jgi:pimeloyl-ACP methyl ester carboxylesterase
MDPSPSIVALNGTTLAYRLAGQGVPLVFIHGHTLDQRMWQPQRDAFAARYQVITYDVRGYGHSGPASPQPHVDIDDLRALLDYLTIDRAHVVGLSMGGGIALDFALTYPARTQALVLVDAAINGWPWSAAFDAVLAPIGTAVQTGELARVKAAWLGSPLFAPAMDQPAVGEALRQIVGDYSGWHWFNHAAQQSPQPPAYQRLDQVAVPTLVVVGEHDLDDFRACAAALADGIPGARLVVLPNAGHMATMEQPAAVNEAVLAFLEAHPALPTGGDHALRLHHQLR